MDQKLYQSIFKRKSFHLFRNVGAAKISGAELEEIKAEFASLDRLYPEIRTAIRIVPADRINFKRDAEYCILIYSEKKENYLMNAGYIGEQLDLRLVSRNIGTLWYGIGKADEKTYDGLDYVIMIAIRKVEDDSMFRKDMFKSKRKALDETWEGSTPDYAGIARFAPSACNSQPWFVRYEGEQLTVFRVKKSGRVGIMPPAMASYFNRIDIGIYLCILELCMAEKGVSFTRELFADADDAPEGLIRLAVYHISKA